MARVPSWLQRLMTLILGRQGGTRPVPPQIGIGTTISDASIEVVEGGAAVDVTVTLFRSGGYTDTVTLGASSLPAGVSVSYPDGQTYTGGTTTRTVRFTAADGSTPIINDEAIVTASGTGVTTSETPITVTILAGEAEAETIAIAPDDDTVSVPQGGSAVITYTLARNGGYTGTVTLAITGLPTGVTASLLDGATWTGSATTLRVQLTAAGDASTVTNDAFTATASGSGVTDATDNGTVSVTAAIDPDEFAPNEPGDYTLLGDTVFSSFSPGDGWDPVQPSELPARPPSIAQEPGPYAATSYRLQMLAGQADGYGGWIDINGSPSGGIEEMFFTTCFKVSENYQHHATITKFIYPYRLTGSGSTQAAAFGFQAFGGVSSGQSRIIVDTQAGAGIGTNLYDNANGYTRNSPLLLDNGTWYRLECQWIYGTPGSNNGALNWWISEWNGSAWTSPVQSGNHTNVIFSAAGVPGKFTRPRWNFFFGGAKGAAIPNDQYIWYNRTRISYKENS